MAETLEGDVLVSGGRVLDPRHSFDAVCNVLIAGGRVLALIPTPATPPDVSHPALRPPGTTACAGSEVDAAGLLVVPGLIDIHAHVYEACTPLGVLPDDACLARGVTTGAVQAMGRSGTAGTQTDTEADLREKETHTHTPQERQEQKRAETTLFMVAFGVSGRRSQWQDRKAHEMGNVSSSSHYGTKGRKSD